MVAGTRDHAIRGIEMNILLWRGWRPAFAEGVTFSAVKVRGIGGTEMQMLWHAQHLVAEGHRVQVFGATLADIEERGVDFVGAADRASQEAAIARGRIDPPELVLLEGAFDGAAFLKQIFPSAVVVHIGQNIDAHAAHLAFAQERHIDLYAFVSLGHFADYCCNRPALRHKFILVRNALPWEEFHGRAATPVVQNKVVWVGAWTKKGLRTWFAVMSELLRKRPTLSWVLCGPAYSSASERVPSHLTWGLDLPANRIFYKSIPLTDLLYEIATARAVLVSLGNETASVSVLDAHAMGRPVISGNDIVYKFTNPDGTGLRVDTAAEAKKAVEFLLDNPGAGDALGKAGRRWVQTEYHERCQRQDLINLVEYAKLGTDFLASCQTKGTTKLHEKVRDVTDKVCRVWRKLRSRR